MKKLSFLLVAVVLLSGAFTSCEKVADELQNATEITVNTSLEAPIVAVPDATKSVSDNSTFHGSYVLDLANNDDLKDYLDKIKSLELKGITVTVTSVVPEDLVDLSLVSGTFSIVDNVETSELFEKIKTDFSLVPNSSFTIGEADAGWENVQKIIESQHPSTVSASGVINNTNYTVTFTISFEVSAVVTP